MEEGSLSKAMRLCPPEEAPLSCDAILNWSAILYTPHVPERHEFEMALCQLKIKKTSGPDAI